MAAQKTIALTREPQQRAFEEAKEAAEDELGKDLTNGDAIREMAEAYTGFRFGQVEDT